MAETWLVCSSCRTDIAYGATHWVCSVSTCNRSRTRLVFCSVACWDAHLGEARHRDAGAIEARAPSKEAWQRELAAEGDAPRRQTPAQGVRPPIAPPPVRRVVGEAAPIPPAGVSLADVVDRDMLIVISKLKKYIKDRSGMNCSDAVADMLSDHVRALCDDAIRAAARDERKTVLDRDVTRARR